jgi:ribose 1,5-bisphosphokinase
MNSPRLVYTIGPSGAGKDSLLAWLQLNKPAQFDMYFAKRCITRAVQAGGEQHESIDAETFHRLRNSNAFALHWHANGLHYGVRRDELSPLQNGKWVLINGSRAHVAQAQSKFPDLCVLHINASKETLRKRLQVRGREAPDAIEARLARSVVVKVSPNVPFIEIFNDDSLDAAGGRLIQSLRDWMSP